ncbi:hypothetical protein BKA70DRAFT_1422888 [Coprinopsis sp. MPI-PUGE-AT-0042]|nr:hypothetical protein BKA70DRAFT_1422888 [Coprinopsis sp. MPI-PUGE-AT-0042]
MSSRIEDWDPDRVDFQGNWGQREARTASDSTVTVSDRVGDKVTARFTGTAVEVWGSGIANTQSGRTIMGFDFLIDNQFVERFSQEVPVQPELQIFRLWASSELPFGEHTIDVEIEELLNAAAVIDYFQVFTSGGAREASTSSQSQTFATVLSNTPPSAPSLTSSGTVASLPTESSSEAQSKKGGTKAPIGPIVGGVIGSILLILLLALAAIWIRKRRQKKEGGQSEVIFYESPMDPPALNPSWHSGSAHDLLSASQPSSSPLFTPPQSKIRSQGNESGTPSATHFLVPAQPKVRPTQTPSTRAPSSSNVPLSTTNINSESIQAGSSPTNEASSNGTGSTDDSRQVVEAIRTLQTYLQRQPEGLGQVAQGLGMATTDNVDTLNPPPAYEERH